MGLCIQFVNNFPLTFPTARDVSTVSHLNFKTKLNSVVRERTIPTERLPYVGEVSAKFAERGCHVVSVTDPYGRILGFLDASVF
jgi:hypothetical protein